MAAHKKQRRLERKESSDSDDNGATNGDEVPEEMEMIEVDFDVKFPESTDRLGIKNLLQQLFLKAHINTSELADLLIDQNGITGVIKEADTEEMEIDDDDVNFGVFSIVNLTEKKNMDCVKEIRSFLLDHCKKVCTDDQYESFKNILDDNENHVGLIISERLINIPPKIAVPLYAGLSYDMGKAKEKKEAFDFAYYVIICKVAVFDEGSEDENVLYANAEEEIIAEEAVMSYDFSVSDEQDSSLDGTWTDEDSEGRRKRRVLLLPASKYDDMYNKMVVELGT